MPTDEYIKRSDALEAIQECFDNEWEFSYDNAQSCAYRIKRIPAADVEPKRKPGHWVYNPGDNTPYCSECLMPQDSECNYCPSCGTKMIPESPKETRDNEAGMAL